MGSEQHGSEYLSQLLWRLSQEVQLSQEFEASLGNIMKSLFLKKENNKT